jgi:hypothetical protein
MRIFRWITALAALALAACGGGSSGCNGSFAGSNCTSTAPKVASILLVSDVSRIPSDNSIQANLIAYVRDANSNFISAIPVAFTTTSGGIGVTQGTTDAGGVAKASLNTLGDKTNRVITVTATSGTVSNTATITVYGTTLDVQGPTALTSGQQGTYTVTLADSAGNGIGNTPVTIAGTGMTVSKATDVTNASGRVTFTATAGSAVSESLQVGAMGQTATIAVQVQSDLISFTSPATNTQVHLATPQTIIAHWTSGGIAVANQVVTFATTRGCINPIGATCVGALATATATTNASGDATISVLAIDAGGASVTATTATGSTASLSLQFISVVPNSIGVQPSVFTMGPGETSTIIATVRDSNNNLVTGTTVVFSLNDVSGGNLSVASALTDLQGRAQTVYTAGATTSAAGGVHITASVQGFPAISSTTNLTVSRKQVFISLGTGNKVVVNDTATQYEVDYVVQVTDSSGAGVANVQLAMSVLSNYYFKGYRKYDGSIYANCFTVPSDICSSGQPLLYPLLSYGCADEDSNRNGILDPGEDNNHNGKIDAGNIALVTPANVTTDATGIVVAKVLYPEEYAYWLQVTLQAQTAVQGTNYYAQSTFFLPGLATDFTTQTNAPPGPISPFGQSNTCTDTN